LRSVVAHGGEAGTRRKRKGKQRSRAKARSKGQRMLSVEVRGSPLPLLGFIDPREPCSLNRTRALRALTVDSRVYH
jgi:hypothetical protein